MVCALFLIAVSHTLEFVVRLQVRIFLVWNYQRSKSPASPVVVDGAPLILINDTQQGARVVWERRSAAAGIS